LKRLVAVKIAVRDDPTIHERMQREISVGAALYHPNACAISDAGTLADGTPFLVMERLFGETLRDALRHRVRLAARAAIDLAVQILSVLDALHALDVVHRDVKPDNVFLVSRLGGRPVVKLLDLGMCAPVTDGSAQEDLALTTAGTVVGTPGYMAPEQVTGMRDFDGRLDVFSVGVVLYEMLSGRRPFMGIDLRASLLAVMRPARSLCAVTPDVPHALEAIVMRAIAREPDERFATARDFQEALIAASAERSVRQHRPTPNTTVVDWDQPTRHLEMVRERAAG